MSHADYYFKLLNDCKILLHDTSPSLINFNEELLRLTSLEFKLFHLKQTLMRMKQHDKDMHKIEFTTLIPYRHNNKRLKIG